MVFYAAVGGSSNLLMHLSATLRMAGVPAASCEKCEEINRMVLCIVDVLPNGPVNYTTVQLYLAGGVPEVILHLRDAGYLILDALTVTGKTLGENLEDRENSEHRTAFRNHLKEQDVVDSTDVIMGLKKQRSLD